MIQIYERSHTVEAWLKYENEDSQLAVAKLDEMPVFWTGCVQNADGDEGQACQNFDIHHPAILGPSDNISDEKPWRAIMRLFSQDWWRRIWICPEATEPHCQVDLICGGFTYMTYIWRGLYAVLNIGLRLGAELQYHEASSELIWSMLNSTAQARHLRLILSKRKARLLWIMSETQGCEATDPRNKVYAAVAIDTVVEKDSLLAPDYSLTVQEVYGRSVEHLITVEDGRLDVLPGFRIGGSLMMVISGIHRSWPNQKASSTEL